MNLKILMLVFISAVFFSLGITNANACWCRNDSEETNTEENFRNTMERLVISSDFVFSGTLVEENDEQLIFEADDVWKGDINDKITFYFPHNVTGNQETKYFIDSCAYTFELGKSYLVYANAELEGLRVNKCGRTNFLDKAQRDVDELKRRKEKKLIH